jgi:hypothetical protein
MKNSYKGSTGLDELKTDHIRKNQGSQSSSRASREYDINDGGKYCYQDAVQTVT